MLAAALLVTFENGIGLLSFAAVAKRLGTNDRTVVYYFPTKDALITEVLGALGKQLQDLLDEAFGSRPMPADDLLRLAWPVLASDAADPSFAVFFEVTGLASARRSPYAEAAHAIAQAWAQWLDPRIAEPDPALRRRQAWGLLARLDGLLLLRRLMGPEVAESAAVDLGVAPDSGR